MIQGGQADKGEYETLMSRGCGYVVVIISDHYVVAHTGLEKGVKDTTGVLYIQDRAGDTSPMAHINKKSLTCMFLITKGKQVGSAQQCGGCQGPQLPSGYVTGIYGMDT